MTRKSSGINSLKIDKNRNNVKPGGNPKITDNFINRIEYKNFEGATPPEGDFEILKNYGKYTINREGIIKLNGKIIKPSLKSGRYYICKKINKGKDVEKINFPVMELMEKCFGKYFPGYGKKIGKPDKYKLEPIDGNYTNMKYNNLKYVDIYEGTKIGIIRAITKRRGLENEETDKMIMKTMNIRKSKLEEIRHDMRKESYEDYTKKTGINISFENYLTIVRKRKTLTDDEISRITGIDTKIIRSVIENLE